VRSYYILLVGLLSIMGIMGCGKSHAPKQAVAVKSDTFTLNEADKMLAQPSNEQITPGTVSVSAVTPAAVANVVGNNETVPQEAGQEAISKVTSGEPDAKMIQQALKNAGFYTGEVDGKVGPKTKEAIKEFQLKNGLVDDGKVGPKTWAILKQSLESASAAVTPATEAIKN
jgi:peptidoglycan hydrolase-like protein with peptidoglycan-binding domain